MTALKGVTLQKNLSQYVGQKEIQGKMVSTWLFWFSVTFVSKL